MGIRTEGSIDIGAPVTEVFEWLVDPEKLKVWLGGASAMPKDRSQLKVGFKGASSGAIPGGGQLQTEFEVTAYEPPKLLAFKMTYAGGEATSTYTLSESGSGTHLQVAGENDWAAPDPKGMEEQIDTQIAGQPKLLRMLMHHQLAHMEHDVEHQVGSGEFDAQVKPQMQAGLETSMQHLKQALELFEEEKKV